MRMKTGRKKKVKKSLANKSILNELGFSDDLLVKAKYISRKKVGDKWVYDYGKKDSKGGKKAEPEKKESGKGKVIEYSEKVETEYNNKYNSELKKVAGDKKVTNENRMSAAEKVYGGKVFINTESGVKFTIEVDKQAKGEDVLKVTAEKGDQKQIKNITPANVPFILG